MWKLLHAPMALLPSHVLVPLVVAGMVVGCVGVDAGLPAWYAALVTAAVSWGGAFLTRRYLAARAGSGFASLPSSTEEDDSVTVRMLDRSLGGLVVLGAAFAAEGIRHAADLGDGELLGVPAAFVLGAIAAVPATREADARYGLHLRRRRKAQRRRDAQDAAARAATSSVAVLYVPLRHDRGEAAAWGAGALALAAGATALSFDGVSLVDAILIPVGVTAALGFAWVRLGATSKPYFLRLSSAGADPLGAGPIPWDAIASATVVDRRREGRWLGFALREAVDAQPWATPRLRRLAEDSAVGVEIPLSRSAWPAERIIDALWTRLRIESGGGR